MEYFTQKNGNQTLFHLVPRVNGCCAWKRTILTNLCNKTKEQTENYAPLCLGCNGNVF